MKESMFRKEREHEKMRSYDFLHDLEKLRGSVWPSKLVG